MRAKTVLIGEGNYELLDLGSYSISIVSIIWNICNTNAEEIKIRSGNTCKARRGMQANQGRRQWAE